MLGEIFLKNFLDGFTTTESSWGVEEFKDKIRVWVGRHGCLIAKEAEKSWQK